MTITSANIRYFKRNIAAAEKFSILIPSWNNLAYLQLCIKSIQENSFYKHQIIVHVNEGSDGTREWIEQQSDIDYSISDANIGVCYALNICSVLGHTDYILYMNDDMYACKHWDKFLWDEITALNTKYLFLSATAIEPKAQSICSIEKNYGTNIETFNEEKLAAEFESLPFTDWYGATWPPNVLHKDLWQLVGGYSTEFSPGMYSDPDFSMKLWQAGVRIFKGISKSRVYHFSFGSTKRVKKNKGYYQFIAKWGITSSTFTKLYLKRGSVYAGALNEPDIPLHIKLKNVFKSSLANFELK
jgi:glycosyltransferase involved in cell wall biosynthesis